MKVEQMNNNKVYMAGKVISEPVFSYEVFGEGFYEFNLEVKRLSDAADVIPATISERLLTSQKLTIGSMIACDGQFRSYNKLIDGKSKLMLTVFVKELLPYDENENPNQIELVGYVCKEPIYRTTPFKREIADVLIAVNRSFNKSDYLPCIAWGRNAKYVGELTIGEKLNLFGRIQSRVYQKKNGEEVENKVAYEISLSRVVKIENNSEISENINFDHSINYYAN